MRAGHDAGTQSAELERLLAGAEAATHDWQLQKAKRLAVAAMEIAEAGSLPEPDRPVTVAKASLALADIHMKLDEPSTAGTLSCRALAALDTPETESAERQRLQLRIMCSLGLALRAQGRYADAEGVLLDALQLAERSFGSEHPAFIEPANGLAVLYKYMARFEEAEALYRRALAIVERGGGSDHEAATLWHNLGGLDHARGRYALAEPAARRAVELRTQVLGPDHPAVAADAAALGAILDALGRTDEAEALFRRAIDTFSTLLGPRHYEVAVNANNLAALYYRKGDYAGARGLWEQALAVKQELFGQTHPEIASTLVNLGVLSAACGEKGNARSLFERALNMLGPDVGSEHQVYRAATEGLAKLS
jgi:tetratricopeptide (TPR) repeat protein